VEDTVCGAADGGLERDRVLERLPREDVGGTAVVLDAVHGEFAGALSDLVALPVLGGRGGGAERGHPERLGDRGHRVGGEHPATGARAGAGVPLQIVELLAAHVAFGVGADPLEHLHDGHVAAVVLAGA